MIEFTMDSETAKEYIDFINYTLLLVDKPKLHINYGDTVRFSINVDFDITFVMYCIMKLMQNPKVQIDTKCESLKKLYRILNE